MKKQILILFLLFLIIGAGCYKKKETRSLKGRVYVLNELNNAEHKGVIVTINGVNDSYVTITDSAGEYTFEEVLIENFKVLFEKENIGKYIFYKNYSNSNEEGYGQNLYYFKNIILTEKSSATISNLQMEYSTLNTRDTCYVRISGEVSKVGEQLSSFFLYFGNENVSSSNYSTIIKPTLDMENFEYNNNGSFYYEGKIYFNTLVNVDSLWGVRDLYVIAYAVPGKYLYEKKIWFDTYVSVNTGDTIYPGLGEPSERISRTDSVITP